MGCGASASKRKNRQRREKPRPAPEDIAKILRFLSKVPLLQQLPNDYHAILAEACEPREFFPGDIIISQGDLGKEFFVICSGEASVHMADPDDVVRPLPAGINLKAGDYFGEKALVHDVPRTATIMAETHLTALRITRYKFRELNLHEKLHFGRRRGVGKIVPRSLAKPAEPKSPPERLFIGAAIIHNESLQAMVSLTKERVNLMIDACWRQYVKKGKMVIEEDSEGVYFYVVQHGTFEVSVGGGDEHPSTVKTLGPGSSFGELALICFSPRSAAVKALTDAMVWVLDRQTFKELLMKNTQEQIQRQAGYLKNVELLRCLLPSERLALAEAFTEMHYEEGEALMEQGQRGTAFYILVEGTVAVLEDGVEVNRKSAHPKLNTTVFLGELALISNEPRTATVRVVSPTATALALDKESFDILLGPLDHLIRDYACGVSRVDREPSLKRLKTTGKGHPRAAVFKEDLVHIRPLGWGSFGTVDLYQNRKTQKYYALKSMSKGYIMEMGMQRFVMSEKDILWSCDSPFIVKLHATYNTGVALQLLMEAATGGDLFALYQRHNWYGSKTHCCFYTASVTCALEHLHGMKVVYRDLKPENVLVDQEGNAKLSDMGLASVCLSKTYTVCGTPVYFAPEMLKEGGHTRAVDWWALGNFMFELLAGAPPFEATDPMQIYWNIMDGIEKVFFPPQCLGARSLITGLLEENPIGRLPMLSDGVLNVERHDFFSRFFWDDFKQLRLEPPFRPKAGSVGDATLTVGAGRDAPPQLPYQDDGSGWEDDF